jgi:pantetheine-phosphate adenylyltransferase
MPVDEFVVRRNEFLEKNAGTIYYEKAAITRRYNVGVYAGSFDPIHIGHQSIIEQAEKVFDKVIIAIGQNPEKEPSHSSADYFFPYHQMVHYQGTLTDTLIRLKTPFSNITLIRGLRNGYDLSYEMNQLKFMRDMDPNIKVVFIPCDPKYEHISSTAIRGLAKIGKADQYRVKKYLYDL